MTAPEGGTFRLVARSLGYRPEGVGPFDVRDGGLMVVQVVLAPIPLPVAGIEVETDAPAFEEPYLARQGFYERAKAGIGTFITPADLRTEVPLLHRTEELFARIPGVFVSSGGVSMRSTTGGSCAPAIFVDGVRASGPLDHGLLEKPPFIFHRSVRILQSTSM